MRVNKNSVDGMPVINENVCGIDVGGTFHQSAIGMETKDLKIVKTFTKNYKAFIKYLRANKVKKVAMESTGSYWQALFYALVKAGFDVLLVDGKESKMLKKKTDVKDARSLYLLHTMGLLNGCFLPDDLTLDLRHYYRHRCKLIQEMTRLSNRMQKNMRLMNVRLDLVLSDINGKSGHNIIEAIIKGERDPVKLASLVDKRVKRSQEEIADSLEGQWKDSLIFLIKDCFMAYKNLQSRMLQVDEQIFNLLSQHTNYELPETAVLQKKCRVKNQININLEKLAYQFYGTNLFEIQSVSYGVVLGVVCELGHNIYKFEKSGYFTSWLRLAPNNKISGGKILSGRVPKGSSYLKIVFRNAANTIAQSKKQTYLKMYFDKIAFRKGREAAITAVARKLAVIVWNMLTHKVSYKPVDSAVYNNRIKKNKIRKMSKDMKKFGITMKDIYMHKEQTMSLAE